MSPTTPRARVLAVYGHAGFDVDTRAGSTTLTVGGAAYYVAMAASTAGCHVKLVTVLGHDFPTCALGVIDITNCRRSPLASAVFAQTYDDGNEITSFEARLNACDALCPELIVLSDDAPAALHIATAPPTQQITALRWLRDSRFDGLISIDTAEAYVKEFRTLLDRHGHEIDFVFLNEREIAPLTNAFPASTRVVVKRGAEGASILENGHWASVRAPRALAVTTTTGAGDVVAGTFLAEWLAGKPAMAALEGAVNSATRFVELGSGRFFDQS